MPSLYNYHKSIIYYSASKSALSSDLGSNLTAQTEKLKTNLGLVIDDL